MGSARDYWHRSERRSRDGVRCHSFIAERAYYSCRPLSSPARAKVRLRVLGWFVASLARSALRFSVVGFKGETRRTYLSLDLRSREQRMDHSLRRSAAQEDHFSNESTVAAAVDENSYGVF